MAVFGAICGSFAGGAVALLMLVVFHAFKWRIKFRSWPRPLLFFWRWS